MLEDTGLYSCPTAQKEISSFSVSCTSASLHLWRHLTKEGLGRGIADFWKNAERRREPRQGWRWVEVLRAGGEGGTGLKKRQLGLDLSLKIAKLAVITQHVIPDCRAQTDRNLFILQYLKLEESEI